jgi:nucleotidyltransferase/DNA polymerase involved in DNA repair
VFYSLGVQPDPAPRPQQIHRLVDAIVARAGFASGESGRERWGVACVWLPQLPLRVEVLRHPAWDGRPLVLGGGPGERKIVRLCSPEAERAGIRPGLPLREVVPLCPEAIVLTPDPVRVAAVLDGVLAALQEVSPAVELADDLFFLALGGLERLHGHDLASLERTIRAAVPPLLRPRVGMADGTFAAAVAARVAGPTGLQVVAAGESAAFLAPLPIGYLPFDPTAFERLGRLGLRTIGELAALPFGAVQAQFGPAGARAHRLAAGRDAEPIVPRPYSPSVRASLRFDDPLASVDAVMAALDRLLLEAFASPALRGRATRQARLQALLSDGTSWERIVTFKESIASREGARRGLRAKLELPGGLPPAPIEELLLELMRLGGEAARQGNLFVARARQLGQIAEAARQLRARYGRVPLYHAVEVEPWSRIPERRWALAPCEL